MLKLEDNRGSVSFAFNLSSDRLEDELNPDDSISQTTWSTKKSSSTTASSAQLKGAARNAALTARAQVLKDGSELKQKQLQLQQDQEQLNLRANISEVDADERVYHMFEERDGSSDRISAVRSSVEKTPLNPNAAEWPACMSGDLKNAVSGAQTTNKTTEHWSCTSVEVKNEMTGKQDNVLMFKGMVRSPLYKVKDSTSVQISQSVMSHASFG